MALALLRRGPAANAESRTPIPWPAKARLFDDPRTLLERCLFRDYPDQPLVRPDTVFTTLG